MYTPGHRLALVIALAISLTLHLALLFAPRLDWRIRRPLPEPMRLNVTLNAPAPIPAVSAPLQTPKPPKTPEPPPQLVPTPNSAPVVATAPDSIPEETPPEPPFDTETLAPEISGTERPETSETEAAYTSEGDIAFPPQGKIRYTVYRGDRGFEIGQATHQWEFAEGRYRLSSVMETTGLASWFRPMRVEMESLGRIGLRGLQPEHYRMKNSKSGEENVAFDWSAWQIKIGDHPPETLQPGSQDLLSQQYQFAYMVYPSSIAIGPKPPFRLWVATGKKYEQVQFDILGPETLELPVGSFDTLHLQSIGKSQTDLWLAPEYLMLPIKIRFTDRDGDTYEQAIREIFVTLPENTPADNPPDTPEPP
jgi:hypothetical protein